MILFSGVPASGPPFPDEVWLWDGAQWKQQSQNPSPLSQFAGATSHDDRHQQMVLFGGVSVNAETIQRRETWVYANDATQQFFTPTIQANPVGAGTFTTSYPGQVGPAYRAGSEIAITATATSPATADFEYWSGDCAGQPASLCLVRLIASSNVIGNFLASPKWIQLGPLNSPPARTNASFAFDISRAESIWFGGLDEA